MFGRSGGLIPMRHTLDIIKPYTWGSMHSFRFLVSLFLEFWDGRSISHLRLFTSLLYPLTYYFAGMRSSTLFRLPGYPFIGLFYKQHSGKSTMGSFKHDSKLIVGTGHRCLTFMRQVSALSSTGRLICHRSKYL